MSFALVFGWFGVIILSYFLTLWALRKTDLL
jgi:hypothetical protein